MKTKATLLHAAASCNRQPGALTALPSHGLVAFASYTNAIILSDNLVSAILPLHTAPITCLHITLLDSAPVLLSTSSNGTLSVTISPSPSSWIQSPPHPAHTSACPALHAVTLNSSLIALTAGADGQLKAWSVTPNIIGLITSLALPRTPDSREFLPECVAAHSLTSTTSLIALGGTNRRLALFRLSLPEDSLSFITWVDGHRDWIRSLSFSPLPPIRLASASADGTARLWHVCTEPTSISPLQPYAQLCEHTAPVLSTNFSPDASLVTASQDCTVAIWKDTTCVTRFGLMGGASAHALAFFGATFSEDALLAHNYTGAVHQWVPDENDQYLSCPPHTGHFARVTAVAWAPSGAFLLSCSADKTARVFAEGEEGFVEWARPQVHGHSIFAVAFCDPEGRRFVSGGEERMLRIFDAPSAFSVPGDAYTGSRSHVSAAVIPPLGLSNRPVCDADEVESGEEGAEKVDDTPWDADGPPLEEVLRQGRLWPEVAKLYGHGNEISCVAVDVTRGVLASACRAQTVRDAEIILWDVSSGTERARLAAHELTVCQMRFSDDTSALACVSKDRSLSVFRRQGDGRFDYRLALQRRGVHARLVHCCAWIGDGLIATGGRDKCIKVFSVRESDEESNGEEIFKRKFDSGVTALDCVWLSPNGKRVLAAGFDRGDIRLFLVSGGCGEEGLVVQSLLQCSEDMRCGGRVSSLQWRPSSVQKLGNITTIQLGIGSEDHSIRIYSFDLTASEEA